MATGVETLGGFQRSETSLERYRRSEADLAGDAIDMEFEWIQHCHGCGDRKRFRGMICDDCRERHGV